MMVSCAVPSEGSKVTHIQQVYCLTQHRLDSLNLVTILCMEDDEIHALQSCIEKCDFSIKCDSIV